MSLDQLIKLYCKKCQLEANAKFGFNCRKFNKKNNSFTARAWCVIYISAVSAAS